MPKGVTPRTAWKPIASAPRDGSKIWLGRPGQMELGFWAKSLRIGPRGGNNWEYMWMSAEGPTPYEADFVIEFEPTCWHEIPEVPAKQRDEVDA